MRAWDGVMGEFVVMGTVDRIGGRVGKCVCEGLVECIKQNCYAITTDVWLTTQVIIQGGLMADVSMTFENSTDVTFNRGPMGWTGASLADANTSNETPDPTLAANGTQTMSMSAFTDMAVPFYDLWCCWQDPNTNIGFGVKIHVPAQLFELGTAPSGKSPAALPMNY